MVAAVHIEPNSVYDDGALLLQLGLSLSAVARARREGKLRFTRQGKRTLYLGKWILAWLDADGRQEVGDVR